MEFVSLSVSRGSPAGSSLLLPGSRIQSRQGRMRRWGVGAGCRL